MKLRLVVYGMNDCIYCQWVKGALKKAELEFEYVESDEEVDRKVKGLTGEAAYPMIEVHLNDTIHYITPSEEYYGTSARVHVFNKIQDALNILLDILKNN
jgi:glutaredoxin